MTDDDVTLTIGVGKRRRGYAVVVSFDDSQAPMVLPPDQAEQVGAQLIACAHRARERDGLTKAVSA